MRIVLMGAPGSGKGTQAARLIKHLGIVHISTGDILRQDIRNHTELGRIAQEYMNQGQLVPDEVILDIVRARLLQDDCGSGFILDGFPRTIPQAEGLKNILANMSAPLDVVINLKVTAEQIVKRLSARRVCQRCGQDFNMITNPPPPDMIHPECGGEIVQRDDDKPETIRKRLEIYQRQTEPLRQYYRQEGMLVEVDGMGSASEVFQRIGRLLDAS